MRRALLGLGLIGALACAGPAAASHKTPVVASQMPAITGDCASASGIAALSCANLLGQANTWTALQTFSAGMLSATLNAPGSGSITLGNVTNGKSLSILDIGSAGVNYVTIQGAPTGFGASIKAVGTDTNVPLNLYAQGASPVQVPGAGGFSVPTGIFAAAAAEQHALNVGVTASFTFDATMHNVAVGTRATPLTAAVTATLPACSTGRKGQTFGAKKMDSSAFNVTLTAATTNGQTGTADLIDGAATVVLSSQYAQVNVQCDGAGNWDKGFY